MVSTQTVFAEKFTVVTFLVQNKYKVSGFINDKNMIEKIQAWIDPHETLVETTYRDYQDFNGLKFPTMIIEKHADEVECPALPAISYLGREVAGSGNREIGAWWVCYH